MEVYQDAIIDLWQNTEVLSSFLSHGISLPWHGIFEWEAENMIFQRFQTIIVSGTTIVSLVWRWIQQKWDVNRGPNIQLSGFHFIN